MKIYRVVWNREFTRYYAATSIQDAIAQHVEDIRLEWDEGENVNWTGGPEYERLISCVELVGELERYTERLHNRILQRICELMTSDPAPDTPDGIRLTELASLVEAHEKSGIQVRQCG